MFTTKDRAQSRGRYVLGASNTTDIAPGERVGVGTMPGKPEAKPVLAHEIGVDQKFLPMYAVAHAIASGKVISPAEVVAAYAETGKLAALKSALEKHAKNAEAGA